MKIDYSLVISVLAFIVSVMGLLQTNKLNKEEYENSRKRETVNFSKDKLDKFHEYNHKIKRDFGYISGKPIPLSDIQDNPELEKLVRDYVNDLEFISYCANKGIYNKEILAYLMGDFVSERYHQFSNYDKWRKSFRPGDNTVFRQTRLFCEWLDVHRTDIGSNKDIAS